MKTKELEAFLKTLDNFRSKNDCPAAPICHAIGNLRTDCVAGSSIMANQSKFCSISIVAFLGHISGISMKPTPSKRIEGFSGQGRDRVALIQKSKTSSESQ